GFERMLAELDLGAARAFVIPEQSGGDADSNHHGATPLLVVEVANESAIADAHVRRLGVIRGNSLHVASSVRVALMGNRAIEIPIRKRDQCDIFDCVSMFADRHSI